MGQPASSTNNAEIAVSTAQPHPKAEAQTEKFLEAEPQTDKTETQPENGEENQPKQKKSMAFKLAFIGLATTLFVFQVDATALGIALPVSQILSNLQSS